MKRLATILALLVAAQGWAISITNIASGSWTNPAIWNPAQIPTFSDTANVTGYTVTVDRLMNVGTLNHTAGTITFNAGANGSTISNDWNFLGGVENGTSTNTIHEYTGTHQCAVGRISPIILDTPGSMMVSGAYNVGVCYILNCAYTNQFTSMYGYLTYVGLVNLNGGTLTNTGYSIVLNNNGTYTNSPLNALPGSYWYLGASVTIMLKSGTTYDLSRFFQNCKTDGVGWQSLFFQSVNTTLPLPSIVIQNVTNWMGAGITIGLNNTLCPNVNIDSCVLASTGNAGLNISDSPNITNPTVVVKITNSTIGNTNTYPGGSPVASLLGSVGGTLTITNSTLRLGIQGGQTFYIGAANGNTYLTNANITAVSVNYSGAYVSPSGTFYQKNSSLTITNQGGNPCLLKSSLSLTSDTPFDTAWIQANGSTPVNGLNGTWRCGTLINSNPTATFNLFGYTLTTSTTSNYSKLIGSNSAILVDQALVNVGASGVFSQMTSTVQFGTTTNAASCNVTNFYNLLCNTPGKSVTLTNSKTVIQGTLASTGLAASNVTWTGGATLTLSNKAYLFSTSPYIRFAGKDVEVWDAAGGTNQLGTGDYWPR